MLQTLFQRIILAKATILDVGHGASTVIEDGAGAVFIVDGGQGGTLLEYLFSKSIIAIDSIIVSHADFDHIGGLLEVLLEESISIGTVYANPDSKETEAWQVFRIALKKRYDAKTIRVRTEVTSNISPDLIRGDLSLEVLYPSPIAALASPGGKSTDQKRETTNSLSAVILVTWKASGAVLLAGDCGSGALAYLKTSSLNIQAKVLVYPHHGGSTGNGDDGAFAESLLGSVNPDLVVFSIDRDKFNNPKPEVIAGVLKACPTVHIACTQLSSNCTSAIQQSIPIHLNREWARGRPSNKCCAGTIVVELGAQNLTYSPTQEEHQEYVSKINGNVMCRRVYG